MTLRRVIVEMVVDGGGHFSPAVIDGVHTCLYYSRPIQHIAVPIVIHTYTITNTDTQTDLTRVQYKPKQGSMNSVPL